MLARRRQFSFSCAIPVVAELMLGTFPGAYQPFTNLSREGSVEIYSLIFIGLIVLRTGRSSLNITCTPRVSARGEASLLPVCNLSLPFLNSVFQNSVLVLLSLFCFERGVSRSPG